MIFEVHGCRFDVRPHGIAEADTRFQEAVHNIRQALIALPAESVLALHCEARTGDPQSPKAETALDKLAELSNDAAALWGSEFVAVLPA